VDLQKRRILSLWNVKQQRRSFYSNGIMPIILIIFFLSSILIISLLSKILIHIHVQTKLAMAGPAARPGYPATVML